MRGATLDATLDLWHDSGMTPQPQANPPKQPDLKKFDKLSFFETDILRVLVNSAQNLQRVAESTPEATRAKQAQMEIQQYCTLVIQRHKGNPAIHAVGPTLDWIVEIPEDQLAAAVRAEIEKNKSAAQKADPAPENKVVEMPASEEHTA